MAKMIVELDEGGKILIYSPCSVRAGIYATALMRFGGSPSALADYLETDVVALHYYRQGERPLSEEATRKIADLLDILEALVNTPLDEEPTPKPTPIRRRPPGWGRGEKVRHG